MGQTRRKPTKTVADQVIDAFGGVTATARALGHKSITTVHSWKRRGRIPDWRRLEIERAAAAAENVTLPREYTGRVA